eukprot:898967_1
MSVSVQSPLTPQVFTYNETISPPSTPLAKRGHFFPSNNSSPMPMFFPANKSVVHHPPVSHKHKTMQASSPLMTDMSLSTSLKSMPEPSVHLKPRRRLMNSKSNSSSESDTLPIMLKKKLTLNLDVIPALPLYSAPTAIKPNIESIRKMPSLSIGDSSVSNSSSSNTKTSSGPVQKLPSFNRGGMQGNTRRRNSLVARSA